MVDKKNSQEVWASLVCILLPSAVLNVCGGIQPPKVYMWVSSITIKGYNTQ